ncbi:anti-sigma factor family protein [Yinghuangia soli]|uniref:Zf-HC2 domain-containing protein n=1 Tax=Yinghuangia soli TaxID=2908204 RepID=A0AA41U7B4_9ACTN|nr:zf-HC2 domain-containing protein [Yinghuangia soli]MCF2533882.1 zf-HC2 domain-containing protein [Yinghuangia soli]
MTPENRTVGPDGHVDVDLLADLAEDLLDSSAAADVRAHLGTCPDCRETYAALAEVRELLGAQPAEPMPDDVFAGLMAVLADTAAAEAADDGNTHERDSQEQDSRDQGSPGERGPLKAVGLDTLPTPRTSADEESYAAPVVDLDEARRRRRRRGWLVAAAAAGALVVGGALIGTLSGSDTRSNDSSAAAPASARGPGAEDKALNESGRGGSTAIAGAQAPAGTSSQTFTASGTEYRRAELREQVAALVARQGSLQATAETSGGTATGGLSGAAPTASPKATGDLAVRPVVPACAQAGANGRTPLAAEIGRFEGRSAFVVVYRGTAAGTADVMVIDVAACPGYRSGSSAPGTAAATDKIIYSATVPLP